MSATELAIEPFKHYVTLSALKNQSFESDGLAESMCGVQGVRPGYSSKPLCPSCNEIQETSKDN